MKLTCAECHLVYTRSDASSHTDKACLREQMLQRDIQINAEFETYRNQQTEMMKTLLDKLDQITARLQEQEQINENINRRFYELAFRIPSGKSS